MYSRDWFKAPGPMLSVVEGPTKMIFYSSLPHTYSLRGSGNSGKALSIWIFHISRKSSLNVACGDCCISGWINLHKVMCCFLKLDYWPQHVKCLFFVKLNDNFQYSPFELLKVLPVFLFDFILMSHNIFAQFGRKTPPDYLSSFHDLISSHQFKLWSLLPPAVMINMIKLHCFLSGILMWWFGGANKSITVFFAFASYLLK